MSVWWMESSDIKLIGADNLQSPVIARNFLQCHIKTKLGSELT